MSDNPPIARREQHLDRVDFLVRKFTAPSDEREKTALLKDPLSRVEVVELKSSGFLWPNPVYVTGGPYTRAVRRGLEKLAESIRQELDS